MVSHNKKMKDMKKEGRVDSTGGDTLGIKGLNMVKRKKLEAYQHLFYLLQVMTKRVQLVGQWWAQQKKSHIGRMISGLTLTLNSPSALRLALRPTRTTWPSSSSRCRKTSPPSSWPTWSSPCTTTPPTSGKNTCCSSFSRRLWRRKLSAS